LNHKKHERLVPGVGWGWNFLGQIQALAGFNFLGQIQVAGFNLLRQLHGVPLQPFRLSARSPGTLEKVEGLH